MREACGEALSRGEAEGERETEGWVEKVCAMLGDARALPLDAAEAVPWEAVAEAVAIEALALRVAPAEAETREGVRSGDTDAEPEAAALVLPPRGEKVARVVTLPLCLAETEALLLATRLALPRAEAEGADGVAATLAKAVLLPQAALPLGSAAEAVGETEAPNPGEALAPGEPEGTAAALPLEASDLEDRALLEAIAVAVGGAVDSKELELLPVGLAETLPQLLPLALELPLSPPALRVAAGAAGVGVAPAASEDEAQAEAVLLREGLGLEEVEGVGEREPDALAAPVPVRAAPLRLLREVAELHCEAKALRESVGDRLGEKEVEVEDEALAQGLEEREAQPLREALALVLAQGERVAASGESVAEGVVDLLLLALALTLLLPCELPLLLPVPLAHEQGEVMVLGEGLRPVDQDASAALPLQKREGEAGDEGEMVALPQALGEGVTLPLLLLLVRALSVPTPRAPLGEGLPELQTLKEEEGEGEMLALRVGEALREGEGVGEAPALAVAGVLGLLGGLGEAALDALERGERETVRTALPLARRLSEGSVEALVLAQELTEGL